MIKSLFGYGGHAREVASFLGGNIAFFVDDEFSNESTSPISCFREEKHEIMIAIADPTTRKTICQKIKPVKYFTFIHHTALISDNVEIGEGSYIGPYCIVNSNVKIGKHSILNRFNSIGHDTVCKDFLSMMPGAILSGNNDIGECVYFGTNSCTKEKIRICNNVTIGLNSGVVNNIEKSGIYVGTPTKIIK